MTQAGVSHKTIIKVQEQKLTSVSDLLVVEAPLEIRLIYNEGELIREKTITVTMRTPGNDKDLVLGFLFSEGIIDSFEAITSIHYCQKAIPEHQGNIIKAILKPNCIVDTSLLERNFAATSSCGVCGKSSISQINSSFTKITSANFEISSALLMGLSKKLNNQQHLFNHTGGLHAAALFDTKGTLLYSKEDIGRHNALDKVIGFALAKNIYVLQSSILVISSRIGYEIIQKAAMAKVPIIIAIGAPSSLAVQIAEKHNITLIGFAKDTSFNIYSGMERITEAKSQNETKLNTLDSV